MKSYEEDMKPSVGDYAHSIAKAAISMVPVAGGALAEFISLIEPPLSKRKNEWFIYLISQIEQLKEKTNKFTFEELAQNEQFVTMFLQATQVAIRNHQKKKIEALKNAILHSILNDPPINESMQMVFLHLIDVMTPWHILVLEFFSAPRDWFSMHQIEIESSSRGTTMALMRKAFPDLVKDESFTSQVLLDLHINGLAETDNIKAMMTENGMYSKRTLYTGDLFLQFISEI